MNSQLKPFSKRKLLSALVTDMAHSLRDHSSVQQVKELLEKQLPLNPSAHSLNKASALEQAADWLDQIQARVIPQLSTDLCSQSPWFGSIEKRLTGLNSATMFIPVSAIHLAEKHPPFTLQQQWEKMNRQTDLLKEQLQRKLDRMTGVRAKTDEWDTSFPEDE